MSSLVFLNCNPVYDNFKFSQIKENLDNVSLKISTSDRIDETSVKCDIIAPDSHFLESWNDHEPLENSFSFTQPTISNIFDTRQYQDSFLKWTGEKNNFFSFIRNNWKKKQKLTNSDEPFQIFWDKLLHDGVAEFIVDEKRNINPSKSSRKFLSIINSEIFAIYTCNICNIYM